VTNRGHQEVRGGTTRTVLSLTQSVARPKDQTQTALLNIHFPVEATLLCKRNKSYCSTARKEVEVIIIAYGIVSALGRGANGGGTIETVEGSRGLQTWFDQTNQARPVFDVQCG